MFDVVYVVYNVVLDVVMVVVCCCCIHPLHGDVLMRRNHRVCRVQFGREWWLCVMLFVLLFMLLSWLLLWCLVVVML